MKKIISAILFGFLIAANSFAANTFLIRTYIDGIKHHIDVPVQAVDPVTAVAQGRAEATRIATFTNHQIQWYKSEIIARNPRLQIFRISKSYSVVFLIQYMTVEVVAADAESAKLIGTAQVNAIVDNSTWNRHHYEARVLN